MGKKSKFVGIVLAGFWCLSLSTDNIILAAVSPSPEETQKIESAAPAKATAVPKQMRKVLVFTLTKGFRHDSIPYITKALGIMGKKTGAFGIVESNDMSIFKAENLKQFDAVCFNNTTRLDFNDPELRKGLMDFVQSGKGIIGIHAATDNFYKWHEGAEMMGGLFDGHPWTSEGTWAFKVDDSNNPINAAFKGNGFKLKEEIYRTKQINLRKNCRVLLSLDMTDQANLNAKGVRPSDKDIPVSWVRSLGSGRVFYCGIGHNRDLLWNPAILQHYLDGIQFALGDLPVDTTPSGEIPLSPEKPKQN